MATLHLVYEKANAPSTRIRLVQMAPHLEARGWACRVVGYPRDAAARRAFAAAAEAGDVALLHRARPSPREAAWWRELPIRRVYDFDDAVMRGRRRGIAGFFVRRRRAAGFARAIACADAATPGNAFLAKHCGSLPHAIIPSAVPLDVARHEPREDATPFRVGWVGRSSNLRYVRAIAPTLAAVARRTALEVVCVSDAALGLPGCTVTNLRWSADLEASHIASFDVGIMPLDPDDLWSRGKCAYKLLQYMAAGVPALGSAVGMNAELIREGENGLLARDLGDWERQLTHLAGDAERRRRLGEAGRRTAQDYGYAAVADRLAAFLDEVARASNASR